MKLGKLYKELRQTVKDETGDTISIKALADKIQLASSRISELENNKREMSLTELKAYHKFFNVSFEYLLGETDTKTTNEDVQIACETTGLSEEAIKVIRTYRECEKNTLSELISFNYCDRNIPDKISFENMKLNFSFVLATIDEYYKTYIKSLKKCAAYKIGDGNYLVDSNCDIGERMKIEKKADELGLAVIDLNSKADFDMELLKNCLGSIVSSIGIFKYVKGREQDADNNKEG